MNIDVTVICSECRGVLETEDDSRMSSVRLLVAPCPTCLNKARDEGRTIGRDEGSERAYEDAREAGIEEGRQVGYDEGLAVGHQEGRREAFLEQKRPA